MNRDDLHSKEAQSIIEELNQLITDLDQKGLKISSWYGGFNLSSNPCSYEKLNRSNQYVPLSEAIDDNRFPWFLYWEIVWVIMNNDFQSGETLLDMGGSSSLFSFYMANKGLKVTTVDLQKKLVDNANYVSGEMNWDLKNYVMDMRDLNFKESFDHVTSICVFEHIPLFDRVKINERMKTYLKPGGSFSITFDYKNPALNARINTPEDVETQFIKASGLSVLGNKKFADNNINYLSLPNNNSYNYRQTHSPVPNNNPTYTFGALFMKRDS